MTEILYFNRIDSHAPIPTIYREVGKRIEYDVSGFVGAESSKHKKFDELETIPLYGNKWQRGLTYLWSCLSDYDIIHTSARYSPITLAPRFISGTKIVFTFHNAEEFGCMDWYFHVYRRMMTRFSDSVTVVSPFLAEMVEDRYGVQPITIANGVNLNRYKPDLETTQNDLFLFIGRAKKRKNIYFIIKLARRRPEYEFTFCASGLNETQYQAIESLPNTDIRNSISEDDLARLYSKSSATLCPFEREGFGMVVIESLASGTPVIALNDGNLPNLINHGENGIICDNLSINDWIDSVDYIYNHPGLFTTRPCVIDYSWENIANQYQLFYKSII